MTDSGAPRLPVFQQIRLLVAATVLLALGTGGAVAAGRWASPNAVTSLQPPWASEGFIAYRCGNELCLMRPNRTGPREIRRGGLPSPKWDPDFSSHGRMLAFRGYYGVGDGQYALYIVGTDGCGVRRLTRSIASHPSWSADGKWISFDTSGEGKIWRVQSNGGGLARITSGKQDSSPAWSPDGARIAFVRYDGSRGQIWVMGTDGSGATLVHADGAVSDQMPSWSHDGSRITFAAMQGRRSTVYVMDSDGTNVRALTRGRGEAWNPVWLPRDAGIAFLAGSNGAGSLFVVRPNGSGLHRVAHLRAEEFAWTEGTLPRRRC